MSQQQVSESLERIKTDDDIYFGVTTVHVTFLPLKKVSGWCLCCGFAGGVLWAYFCFGGVFFGYFAFFVPYGRGFTHFCSLCALSFLTSCHLLRVTGQERAVSEIEE